MGHKIFVAILDKNNIYQGIKEINKTSLKKSHIIIDKDCDLAVGGYEWNGDENSFIPTQIFIEKINSDKVFKFKKIKRGKR
jgi:hypothetical protein